MSSASESGSLEVATPAARRFAALRLRLERSDGFTIAVALVAAWAAVANLARLGFPETGVDEPVYALAGWRYVHLDTGAPVNQALAGVNNFEHPPLAKYLFGLAELTVGHPSVVAARVVAALCTLGTAVLLGVWLGRAAGRWVGLGAAAMLAVLPMSIPQLPFRFGRYAYLDAVAGLFALASVALAWEWFRRAGRAGWWFAVGTGVGVGLATASKESGFLGAVGPILVGLIISARAWRDLVVRLCQAGVAGVVTCAVFASTLLGLGDPLDMARFIVRYQHEHATLGHRVEFAGRVSFHPPAWAFLWFVQHGLGGVVTVFCLICVAAAVGLRRDRLVLWCVAALAGPLIFHMAVAGVILSFYWVMWMPAFVALVALGAAELVRLARSPRAALGAAAGLTAAASVVVFTAASAHDTYRMLSKTVPDGQPYSRAVLSHSPLIYLRLDETAGSVAADSSGNGHAGSYVGGPRLGAHALVSAQPGRAVAFHGFRQYVSVPGGTWMDVPDYSVAVWLQGTRPGEYLFSRDDFVQKVWNLQLDESGHLRFVTYASFGGAGQSVDSRAVYDDGRPHLAVCVKDAGTMRLYVDGRLVGSASWPTFARSATVGIDLARRGNNFGYFAGTLDEFAFYDTVLSAAQVRALFDAGTSAG
jgi:4-amino-4-deoxy-L-arabinose transferase-like glycosyltransferase